jgi:Tfp pilus tip-associated adhesin PilY1
VGGNDGMLHAFNAETGFERFAYVPNLVFDNLSNLAETEFNHKFYVDTTPYARKRVSDSIGNPISLLVGGLGKGGKGYYCLNITDADSITAISTEDDVDDMVLWEYPQRGVTDDDMGYSYSVSYIVRTNLKNYPWVVIFGNGYDSVNGSAVLYVLDPLTGSVIRKIDTTSGSCNGLSTPIIIDVDNDLLADYAYAGDLQGNLWKFDLTGEAASDWDVAYKDGGVAHPLFTALGQPITSRPDVMRHPDPDLHGYMVIFGTGRYLAAPDRLDVSQQSVYGIWDYGDDADDSEFLGVIADRSTGALNYPSNISLQKQTVLEVENSCGDDYRILTDNEVQWQETDSLGNKIDLPADDSGQNPDPVLSAGWFFDFPNTGDNAGERVIKNIILRGDRVIVLSFIPNSSLCSGGGDSWFYIMDPATGGRTELAQMDINGDGVIKDPVDENGDGTIDSSEMEGTDICDAGGQKLPPTGRKKTGMLHDPKIVRKNDDGPDGGGGDTDVEIAYISTSAGTIEDDPIRGENLGVYYWREK